MADGAISVRSAVSFSWSLWTANWRTIWGVLALNSLAGTVAMAGSLALNDALYLAGLGAALIFSLMSDGAVFRLALADRHVGDAAFSPGPSGLQWQMIEWRMFAAKVLLGVFMAIVAMLLLVALWAVAIGVVSNNGGPVAIPMTVDALTKGLGPAGAAVVSALVLVSLGAVVFVGVRLSLAAAATVDAGKIQVLSTWRMTRGRFWQIFFSLLLIIGPSVLVSALLGSGVHGAGTTPVQMTPSAALFSGLILGVLSGGVMQPLIAGVLAYYCRHLRTTAPGGTT